MASLLDLVIQNRRPQGGLLGSGSVPSEASPLAALGAAGGNPQTEPPSVQPPPDVATTAEGLLTDEDRDRIRSQTLLALGLGTLIADGGRGDLARLAQGALLGTETARQTKQDLLEQKIDLQQLAIDLREEQQKEKKRIFRRKVFANVDLSDPEQRTQVMEQLMSAGDFEGADRLNSFESNMPEAELIENGNEMIVFDPRTLEKKGTIETPDERPEGTELVNRGTRSDLIDSNTGQVIASFSHELSPQELRERQDTIFSRTDKLADDFRSETSNLQQSVSLGQSAMDAPRQDPAAQQTLVIALNKLLDPGSVVRQSEFARVQEIGGFKAEAQTFANRLMEEGQLPPEVEQKLRNEIARLTEVNQARVGAIADQFRDRAQTFGVNPDFVVRRGLIGDEPEEVENPFEGL